MGLGAALRREAAHCEAELRAGLVAGAKRGLTYVSRRQRRYSGRLAASWRVEVDAAGTVVLINTAPHAGIDEVGARPHAVSLEGQDALREWIRRTLKPQIKSVARQRKAYGAADRGFGKLHQKLRQNEDDYVEEILRAVLWKIRTKGQVGTFTVAKSLPQLRTFAEAAISRELGSRRRG